MGAIVLTGVGLLLLMHGVIHLGFVGGRPANEGGVRYPFTLERSWALSPLGVPATALKTLGVALVMVTLVGFAAAALAIPGWFVPSSAFAALTIGASLSSAILLATFWDRMLIVGLVLDALFIGALLWTVWPERIGLPAA